MWRAFLEVWIQRYQEVGWVLNLCCGKLVPSWFSTSSETTFVLYANSKWSMPSLNCFNYCEKYFALVFFFPSLLRGLNNKRIETLQLLEPNSSFSNNTDNYGHLVIPLGHFHLWIMVCWKLHNPSILPYSNQCGMRMIKSFSFHPGAHTFSLSVLKQWTFWFRF